MKTEFTRKELCELMEEFADRANAFNAVASFLPETQQVSARSAEAAYRECARLVANLVSS
jgi:hypothetical protein